MPSQSRALPRFLTHNQKCCFAVASAQCGTVEILPHVLITLMVNVQSGLLEFIRDGRNHHPGAFLWGQHRWSSFAQELALVLVISCSCVGSCDQSVLSSLEDAEDPCPGQLPRCLLLFLT